MACYPGSSPYYGPGPYGPVPGPFGPPPCNACGINPCGCGVVPYYSGVGKCAPNTVAPCSAWEIVQLPTNNALTSTNFSPIYTSSLRSSTTITSIAQSGASPNVVTVVVNLSNVKGRICTASGTLNVTLIVAGALQTYSATASASVTYGATSATLNFTLPAGAGTTLVGTQSTLSLHYY